MSEMMARLTMVLAEQWADRGKRVAISSGEFRDDARAVLAAMRSPSEVMRKVGSEGYHETATEVWQAMIDAAMTGEGE